MLIKLSFKFLHQRKVAILAQSIDFVQKTGMLGKTRINHQRYDRKYSSVSDAVAYAPKFSDDFEEYERREIDSECSEVFSGF